MATELTKDQRDFLRKITGNPVLLEVIRRAIEDELIDLRDRRMWLGMPNNGFVCKDKDGEPSSVIRFSTAAGVKLGLLALAEVPAGRLAELDDELAALRAAH